MSFVASKRAIGFSFVKKTHLYSIMLAWVSEGTNNILGLILMKDVKFIKHSLSPMWKSVGLGEK